MTPGFGYQYARRNIYFFTYFCGRTDIQKPINVIQNPIIVIHKLIVLSRN